MDYRYLGDVVPAAIVALLVLLAFIVGLIPVVTIRSHYSNRTGWLPRRLYQAPEQQLTHQDVQTRS
jgi:hypothetical protein